MVPKDESKEQPKIISASEQETLDAKYAVLKSPKRYVDEPKKSTGEPSKKDNPDSIISKIEANPTKEEADMTEYIKRKNEVKGEVASLDKKAESFGKLSKFGFGLASASTVTALVTWFGAGSLTGSAALLPILAPVALPIMSGAVVIGGIGLAVSGISKLLKERAKNRKYDLQNDNRAMFQYN